MSESPFGGKPPRPLGGPGPQQPRNVPEIGSGSVPRPSLPDRLGNARVGSTLPDSQGIRQPLQANLPPGGSTNGEGPTEDLSKKRPAQPGPTGDEVTQDLSDQRRRGRHRALPEQPETPAGDQPEGSVYGHRTHPGGPPQEDATAVVSGELPLDREAERAERQERRSTLSTRVTATAQAIGGELLGKVSTEIGDRLATDRFRETSFTPEAMQPDEASTQVVIGRSIRTEQVSDTVVGQSAFMVSTTESGRGMVGVDKTYSDISDPKNPQPLGNVRVSFAQSHDPEKPLIIDVYGKEEASTREVRGRIDPTPGEASVWQFTRPSRMVGRPPVVVHREVRPANLPELGPDFVDRAFRAAGRRVAPPEPGR